MRFYEFQSSKPSHRRIDENLFSQIASWFKSKLNLLFSSLGFGETKSVSIPIPSLMNEVKVSSVGYYHEWLIMQKLRDSLQGRKIHR